MLLCALIPVPTTKWPGVVNIPTLTMIDPGKRGSIPGVRLDADLEPPLAVDELVVRLAMAEFG